MSNQYYELNWRNALKEIEEVYKYEFEPLKENINKKKIKYRRKDKEWFTHYSNLYIKYIKIFKTLENCHENSNNPQKKKILKEMLENILKRVLIVKKHLIRFNTHPKDINSDFPNLHKIIEKNDLILNFLETPIPRYFTTGPEVEKREDLLKEIFEKSEKENIEFKDHKLYKRENPLQMSVLNAINIIKKMERGRQGIEFGLNEKKRLLEVYKKNFLENNINEYAGDEISKRKENIIIIQKYIRGFFDRKSCNLERKEEMKFLNLEFDEQKLKNLSNKTELIHLERKQKLKEMENEIQDSFFSIKKNLLENEGLDVKEKMLDERRKFIINKFEESKGKELPVDIKLFYEKDVPVPEDEKGKKDKNKKPSKPQKNKKLTEDEIFLKEREAMGPENSIELKKLKELIKKYFEDWGKQINLNENLINRDIIIKEIFPEIKKEIQVHVDKIVNIEIQDLHYKLNISKKKPAKNRKKTKTKKKKIPGENLVDEKNPIEIAKELTKFHILRKPLKKNFSDFITTENIIRNINQEEISQMDPSLSQLKNTIIEQLVLPLGTGFNPEMRNRTYLFYGPNGSGKSHMINAIVNQTKSAFFDISPVNLCKVFTSKNSISKIMYKIFMAAKFLQPSVIYFDETEHFFAKKNLKKLKNFAGKCSKFKKDLIKHINKHLTLEDKVVVIGCTSNPKFVHVNDAKKFFYKKFYFPFPDYSARRFIFEKLIKKHIKKFKNMKDESKEVFLKDVDIPGNFPFGMLAFHTEGYTLGSFIKLIKTVLSDSRIERFEIMPLKIEELIDPLSNLDFCSKEEYEEFKNFGFAVTGMKERLEKKNELQNEIAKNKKKKKR